jgi:hypothetical protein
VASLAGDYDVTAWSGSGRQPRLQRTLAAPRRDWPEWEVNQAAAVNWCQMRRTIAAIAYAEERRWTRPNGTKYQENHPSRLPILTEYWSAVGFSATEAAGAAQRSANDDLDWPWSAAFICFVMRQAGVQRAHGFEFGQRHMNYIVGALRNRERSDRARPFWLVDAIELQLEAVPQSGDLLCFNRLVPRRGQPPRWTTYSVASLRNQFWLGGNQNQPPRGSAHCSLVVGSVVDTKTGRRLLETIGGNEGGSVRLRRIPIDQSGGIPNPQAHHIFGMIKLVGC